MDKICYWDEQEKIQKERDATAEEQAEIDASRATGPSLESINAPILAALAVIDMKTIRPMSEGEMDRVAALRAEAAALRAQLVKV